MDAATNNGYFEELAQGSAMAMLGSCSGGGRLRFGYEPNVIMDKNVGQPRLDVPKEQLEYLLSMGFSGPQISTVIGVSLSTVR